MSKDRDARRGRVSGGYAKGYKLHAWATTPGLVRFVLKGRVRVENIFSRVTFAGLGHLPRSGTDQPLKEVKFAVFYDQPKEHRHALATAGDGAEMGRLLRLHAARVGVGHARQSLGLTDGAAWIARQLDVNLPVLTARILDFYHLASHMYEAARVCLGEGTRLGHRLGVHRGGGQEPGPPRPQRGHEVRPAPRGGPDEPQGPVRERPSARLLGTSRDGVPQLMGTPNVTRCACRA